jgi:hypothetical protein
VESHFDSDADLPRYEALLEMADLVVHHHNLPELFAAMAGRLRQVAAADAAHFALYDPVKNVEGSTLVTAIELRWKRWLRRSSWQPERRP